MIFHTDLWFLVVLVLLLCNTLVLDDLKLQMATQLTKHASV